MAGSGPESEVLLRLVGVYDADGTWRGEVTYWIGARLGRIHCALCEITHSMFREKRSWRQCTESMPVPFDTVHRDERSSALAAASRTAVPCVVAETDQRRFVLLDAPALEACGGSPDALADAIEAAVDAAGLAWPSGSVGSPP